MASPTKIPREVQESIRDALDRKVKVSLKLLVKMEIKGVKTENKVLALTPCRLFVLNAKVPSKLENSFHFLDIQSIESKKPNQLALTIDGKAYAFQSLDAHTEEMDHIITHIGVSLRRIFPAFPLERLIVNVDVQPPERLKVMQDMMHSLDNKGPGPCGGYTTMYQCMCDYHGFPFREEVEWDVDTIYLSLDTREFRLQDFDHLMPRDLIPIIGALEHNTWFRVINCSNVKLSPEACGEFIRMMKRNAVIEEVNLSNTGIRSDFLQKFALALISNSGTQLSSLDVSNNLLEDRGVHHLLGALKILPCGLTSLDLSRSGISTKCLNKVGEVLSQTPSIISTLTSLRLNDNGQKGEDFPVLYNFLAQPNSITHLDLSLTDCALDALSDPLLRGCPSLVTLKVAGTTFTHKRSKEVQVPQSWKQLFSSACCLEHVDLSSCRLPPEALKEMLLGLTANRNLKGVNLDISSNDLGQAGAAAMAPCMASLKGVYGLDLSNNGFDTEMKSLLPEIAKNKHLKKLSVGRNFARISPKYKTDVMNALTQLLQETSSLESLSLADSKLKGDLTYVINALGSNETIVEIDISGNDIKDIGARLLAKALLINSRLINVVWDKNNVSTQGFEDVAEAVQRNMTLKKMPYPINDATAALKTQTERERIEIALQKIETCLQRNHSPRRFAPDQAYRLQQGFLISSTQQMVDRLVVQVEDAVNALQSNSSLEPLSEELIKASKLVADANNCTQLLPNLQDIAIKSQAAGNSIDSELQALAEKLRAAIEDQMKKTTEEMIKCTSTNCPAIMADQAFQGTLQEGCQSKSSLPKDFTTGVLETVGTDIYNTTSEMNLNVAALISDSVIDGVIDNLSSTHKTLISHLNLKKSGKLKEAEQEESESARLRVPDEVYLMGVAPDPNSPKFANKRKSVLNRKTRPQSTMAERGELSLPAPKAPSVENHTSAGSSPSGSKEQLADFSELPALPSVSKPLDHLTKGRPHRERKHRPTRPTLDTGTTEMEESPDNGPGPQAVSPVIHPPPSSSPKTKDKKDHKNQRKESQSGSKPKQDDVVSGKSEGKKWKPNFMKKKDDKAEKDKAEPKDAKKSNSFSFNPFKKRGSEDKRKASAAEGTHSFPEEKSASDIDAPASGHTSSDMEDGRKEEVDVSLDVVKEVEPTPQVSVQMSPAVEITPPEEEAPPPKIPEEKQAIVPPRSRGRKSPATVSQEDKEEPKKEDEENQQEASTVKTSTEEAGIENDVENKDQEREVKQEKEEKQEKKLPAGLAKMPGLGALGGKSLVEEMKLRQTKRLSQRPLSPGEETKEPPSFMKPTETNNNTQDSAAKVTSPPSKPSTTPPSTTLAPMRPATRTVRPVSADTPTSSDSLSTSSSKPSGPSPAPRVMPASRRPVSVVEAPGQNTANIPSSMTTSTPEFGLDESAGPSSKPRPVPSAKPRPAILPRPKKRESVAPAEESSDIPPHPSASPSAQTSKVESAPTIQASPPVQAAGSALNNIVRSTGSKRESSDSFSKSSSENSETKNPEDGSNITTTAYASGANSSSSSSPQHQSQIPSSHPTNESKQAAPEEGIVYDSATLRMSVKDKIKRLSQAQKSEASQAQGMKLEATPSVPVSSSAIPHGAKVKAMSLPKNARLPGTASGEENGREQPTDNLPPHVVDPIKEEDSPSATEQEGQDQEESKPKPAVKEPDDEIMV